MFNGFYPQYDLAGRIQHTKFSSGFGMPSVFTDEACIPALQSIGIPLDSPNGV